MKGDTEVAAWHSPTNAVVQISYPGLQILRLTLRFNFALFLRTTRGTGSAMGMRQNIFTHPTNYLLLKAIYLRFTAEDLLCSNGRSFCPAANIASNISFAKWRALYRSDIGHKMKSIRARPRLNHCGGHVVIAGLSLRLIPFILWLCHRYNRQRNCLRKFGENKQKFAKTC